MKVHINVLPDNKKNILTLLEESGYALPCNCHGRHLCNGRHYPFDCSMIPTAPIEVELPAAHFIQGIALEEMTPQEGSGDTLLIDLGTTTIAMALIRQEGGLLRRTAAFPNPQLHFGTDVIARIHAASSGMGSKLQQCLKDKLASETALLCQRNHQKISELRHCYIGGNTTMIHLLMGFDCSPLGHSPFQVREASPEPFTYHSCEIHIAPWISAFVGGDITAGLSVCKMYEPHKSILFIDLGTNGEMVLSHNGTFYTAATAAGPAFEGGGLSCGCPGIPGAIRRVRLRRLSPVLDTIGNKLPIGICGSGAISICAELVRGGYITKEGILTDLFPENGILLAHTPDGKALRFTAGDLRNVQLAAAAIAAGIDTLLQEGGLDFPDVDRLWLGGGFGSHVALSDCETLKLFSGIPISHVKPLGNTCLRGLYQWASSREDIKVPENCHCINLADHPCFKQQFIRHM